MGRVFIDGFEMGSLGLWDAGSGSVATGITGMDGIYCAYLGITDYLNKLFAAAKTEIYLAFLYRPTQDTNSKGLVCFQSGGTQIASLIRDSGVLKATKGTDSSTIIATGTTPIAVNTTYFIEVYYKCSTTAGEFDVKVNGVSEFTFSGATSLTLANFDRLTFGNFNSMKYAYAYFDNIVIDDAAWIGLTKIQALVPTGAGATTQWTPSAGANWSCIDEIPPSDTDYVTVNVVDQIDTYAASDLVGAIASIKALQIQARCVKEGAAVPQNIQLGLRSGGANHFGNSIGIPTVIKSVMTLFATNPATGNPFTTQEIQDLEIGMQSKA